MKISSVWLIISFVCVLPWCSLAQNSPEDYLEAHNAARAKVGVKPLKWNLRLEWYSRAHLTKHIGDCKPKLSPVGESPYGESIFSVTDPQKPFPEITGANVVGVWVAQKQYYDEKSNSCVGGNCRGYTQVVWSDTTHEGCARVKCNNGSYMVSCNYYPPGNYELDRPY